jgi:glutamate-1-semialdehyde 2,1-aminomutase
MFQYYLRAQGIAMSWVGTGRFHLQPRLRRRRLRAVAERFVAAPPRR